MYIYGNHNNLLGGTDVHVDNKKLSHVREAEATCKGLPHQRVDYAWNATWCSLATSVPHLNELPSATKLLAETIITNCKRRDRHLRGRRKSNGNN